MLFAIDVTCPFCGTVNTVYVFEDDFEDWQNGALAQDCFPYLAPEERELLISHVCPDCWSKMF